MEEEELEKQMVLFSNTLTLSKVVLAINFTHGKESRVKMNLRVFQYHAFSSKLLMVGCHEKRQFDGWNNVSGLKVGSEEISRSQQRGGKC